MKSQETCGLCSNQSSARQTKTWFVFNIRKKWVHSHTENELREWLEMEICDIISQIFSRDYINLDLNLNIVLEINDANYLKRNMNLSLQDDLKWTN